MRVRHDPSILDDRWCLQWKVQNEDPSFCSSSLTSHSIWGFSSSDMTALSSWNNLQLLSLRHLVQTSNSLQLGTMKALNEVAQRWIWGWWWWRRALKYRTANKFVDAIFLLQFLHGTVRKKLNLIKTLLTVWLIWVSLRLQLSAFQRSLLSPCNSCRALVDFRGRMAILNW